MIKNIISITANSSGQAIIYQRKNGKITSTVQLFDNWIVSQDTSNVKQNWVKLSGDLPLRYLIKSHNINDIAERLGYKNIIKYNNLQQYLIISGNSYFQGMEFEKLHRLQFDIQTTQTNPNYISNPQTDKIILIALSDTNGYQEVITGEEVEIIQKLVKIILQKNPDVIENHNIFGFDLPFLIERAKKHGIKLNLGRDGSSVWSYEDTVKIGSQSEKFTRYVINGREVIDTMFLTRRRIPDLHSRGYGLQNTAQYLGVAPVDRIEIDSDKMDKTWQKNPDKVIEYVISTVREVRAISNKLLPVEFQLTKIFPDKLDRVATEGTGKLIDMLFIKEYLKENHSIPKPTHKKAQYQGGFTKIYRKGVIKDVVLADVSSLYPSIMQNLNVKPDFDPLNVFQNQLQKLTQQRLDAKAKLKSLPQDSQQYNTLNAYQTALKLIINSFYGVLGASFTHFNSPQKGAPKVTASGRDILVKMVEEIEELGGIPVEADTDGVYFAGIKKRRTSCPVCRKAKHQTLPRRYSNRF